MSEAEAADIQATQTPFMSVSTKNWKEVFTPEQLVEVEKMRTKGSSLRCLNKVTTYSWCYVFTYFFSLFLGVASCPYF